MAVAALVLGLVAIVFCWVAYLAIPCGAVALILGIIHLVKLKKSEDKKGKGMSIAGIITGAIGMIISLTIIIIVAVAARNIVKAIEDYEYDWNNYSYDYENYDYNWLYE